MMLIYLMQDRGLNNFLLLIIFTLLFVGCYLLFGNLDKGVISGKLINFNKRGFLIKTYEGNFNYKTKAGNSKISDVSTLKFSVHDGKDKVVEVLQDALITGKLVKVKYEEKFIHVFWRGDTRYFIIEAEIIK